MSMPSTTLKELKKWVSEESDADTTACYERLLRGRVLPRALLDQRIFELFRVLILAQHAREPEQQNRDCEQYAQHDAEGMEEMSI